MDPIYEHIRERARQLAASQAPPAFYRDFPEEAKQARAYLKSVQTDFELLDKEVDKILWTYTNLFPGCLIKSVEGIRLKKKFFWDQAKTINRHWLAVNMNSEAYLGFAAFNSKKITGQDVIDFIPGKPITDGHTG